MRGCPVAARSRRRLACIAVAVCGLCGLRGLAGLADRLSLASLSGRAASPGPDGGAVEFYRAYQRWRLDEGSSEALQQRAAPLIVGGETSPSRFIALGERLHQDDGVGKTGDRVILVDGARFDPAVSPVFQTMLQLWEASAPGTAEAALHIASGVLSTLTPNENKMKGALNSFMLATDLSEYLVRKGVPFRETHHISGAAVKLSEDRGVPLSSLTVDDLKPLCAAFQSDVDDIWSYEKSAESRDTEGGTSRRSVLEQCAKLRAYLAENP